MTTPKPGGSTHGGKREGVRFRFGGQAIVDRKAEALVDDMSRLPKTEYDDPPIDGAESTEEITVCA